jgi:hypothetical protein
MKTGRKKKRKTTERKLMNEDILLIRVEPVPDVKQGPGL